MNNTKISRDDSPDPADTLERAASTTTSINSSIFKQKNFWKCCGDYLDRRLVTYMVQVTFTLITLLFCMIQVTVNRGENDQMSTIWVTLISAIVGNFMPTAQLTSINTSPTEK